MNGILRGAWLMRCRSGSHSCFFTRHVKRLAELQQAATGQALIDHEQAKEDFLVFYEDLYMEFSKFGRIDALHVCDNLGE